MDSPIRQYQKQKDYLRHKLFRKIKRRKRAQAQQEAEAPIREMRRRVLRRFKDGKDIKRFDDGEDINRKGNDRGDNVLSIDEELRKELYNKPAYYYNGYYRRHPTPIENLESPLLRASELAMNYLWNLHFGKNTENSKTVVGHGSEGAIESGGIAQRTYLAPRSLLNREFRKYGYIQDDSGDYGLVKKAVGNRKLPIWQRHQDAEKRLNLVVLGNNINNISDPDALEILPPNKQIIHGGFHPEAYYVDPTSVHYDFLNNIPSLPKFYAKSWDLNDYGGKGSSTQSLAGKILDAFGNPVVQTSGYLNVGSSYRGDGTKPDIDKFLLNLLDEKMKKSGLVKYIENPTLPKQITVPYTYADGSQVYWPDGSPAYQLEFLPAGQQYWYGLPELTVTPNGNYYNSGKDSGIHINPKNRGKFNALKKRTGKTTEQLTHSKNPLTRKRAIFALNARKWHHKQRL